MNKYLVVAPLSIVVGFVLSLRATPLQTAGAAQPRSTTPVATAGGNGGHGAVVTTGLFRSDRKTREPGGRRITTQSRAKAPASINRSAMTISCGASLVFPTSLASRGNRRIRVSHRFGR